MHRVVLLALLSSGCVATQYSFTPSTKGEVAKPHGCQFEIFDAPPDKSFEEVGILKHYNGDVPKTTDALRSSIKDRVCEVGGDAVVADPDASGQYMQVTVIKYSKRFVP
jgi:hypothetical protein